MDQENQIMYIEEIKEILPHRYPFLLVDRILEISNEKAVGLKNVTTNEEFFNGHFPVRAMMPGVLQIEAMAQVAGVSYLKFNKIEGKMATLAGVSNAKFRRPVVPGDQLKIEIIFERFKRNIGKAKGKIFVDDKIVSEADLIFAIIEA